MYSGKGDSRERLEGIEEKEILVEADFFISILTADNLSERFRRVAQKARDGVVRLFASSEVYDDVINALRSQGARLDRTAAVVADMEKIPHRPIAMTAGIASDALNLFDAFGDSRKLHYFDAFHVATARTLGISMLTSDKFIVESGGSLHTRVIDARKLRL